MSSLLEVRDLHTHFMTNRGIVKAVNGVDLDVEEGKTLGLVGESGCGKSATALSIMRLVRSPPGHIAGGRVLFEGKDLLQTNAKEMGRIRGRKISMIFQEPMTSLNPVLTIGRQLTEGMEFHLGMTSHEAERNAVRLLGLVQIPEPELRLSQYPHQFSGGMLQRVMLAMALSCGPKLILADEPTTALDVTVQAHVLELMKDLTRQFGMATILISHNLGVIARYADRVDVMYAGKVVERGSVFELFGDPRHPYTRGLLRSVPRLDVARRAKLEPIRGQPPDPLDVHQGCSYRPRCEFAIERCGYDSPELMSTDGAHLSACWVARQLSPLRQEVAAPVEP